LGAIRRPLSPWWLGTFILRLGIYPATTVGAGRAIMWRRMKSLPWQDLHHLQAAEGWLGLGSWREANEEIEEITPELRIHPSVLRVRWAVYDAGHQWELAMEVASALVLLTPQDPAVWLLRSFALHQMKRTREARDSLVAVVSRFPDYSLMSYNLACYEAVLGNFRRACGWLRRAFGLPADAELRAEALEDRDLQSIWPRIGTL
jgi:tetratricopeptide (TPR) repeat protein